MISHAVSYPYPTFEQFKEVLPTFLAKLRGEQVELNCLIHCGATAMNFALGMAFPHPAPIGFASAEADPNVQEFLTAVESHGAAPREPSVAVSWISIFLIVVDIVRRWFTA